MGYQKYVYWLEETQFLSLKDDLKKNGFAITDARKAVCVPLAGSVKIGFVPPDTWKKYELCKRQLSWYGASPHAGQVLVVTSFELNNYGLSPENVIRHSEFRPPSLPGREEKLRMKRCQKYQKAKPTEWENIEDEDPALHDKWLKIMGVRGTTYQELFITHCANHANFIEPTYYITEGQIMVPYSIAKTPYICSACLEFYNIIGASFKKKYVTPCPGAVLFAGMVPSRYYEVVQP